MTANGKRSSPGAEKGLRCLKSHARFLLLIFVLSSSFPVWASLTWDFQASSILQTSDGAMWFDTDSGFTRFEAVFSTMTGPNGSVDDLCCFAFESSDGALWFGAGSGMWATGFEGVLRYDGSQWEQLANEEGPGTPLAAFETADGSMWFGTFAGASHYDGESWEHFEIPGRTFANFITSVSMAPDESLWFGTQEGVVRFSGGTWESFPIKDGSRNNSVSALYAAADGSIWIGTDRGVSRFEGETWQTFTAAHGLASHSVHAIYESADGKMWFGTSEGATSLQDNRWDTIFNDERIWSIYESEDGAIWFASDRGVTRRPPSGVGVTTVLSTSTDFASAPVSDLLETFDGTILVGTSRGLAIYDRGGWSLPERPGAEITALYQSADSSLWVGTAFGVTREDDEGATHFSTGNGLVGDSVAVVTQSGDGAMWFGTPSGVSRLRDGEWTFFNREDGLADNRVRAIVHDTAGSTWFGTPLGATRFADGEWRTFNSRDGLEENVLAMLASSDGAVWAVTGDSRRIATSASRFDGSGWTVQFSDTVHDLTEASDGGIWLGTPTGMSRWDGESTLSFGRSQLPFLFGSVRSIMAARDGAIWMGGVDQVARFVLPGIPQVQSSVATAPPDGVLSADRFLFEFVVLDFSLAETSDEEPLVSVALKPGVEQPTEADWSSFSPVREYEVTGLDNGIYTFYTRGVDQYGNVERVPGKSTFSVDLVGPTVVILSPSGVIEGVTEIIGSVFDASIDPNLESFKLEYGKGRFESEVRAGDWETERLSDVATEPVVNGRLGIWDTNGLSDFYVLRLTALDSFNRRSTYVATVNIVPAVADIDSRIGGHVRASDGSVDLYIPPDALDDDAQITINSLQAEDVRSDASAQLRFVGPAYVIGPDSLSMRRPATFTFSAGGEADSGEERVALFKWNEEEDEWVLIGGTVEEEGNRVSAPIAELGTYALFQVEGSEETPGPALENLSCQPRMLSPRGGGFAGEMQISFDLGGEAETSVRVFNAAGHQVRELVAGRRLFTGSNAVTWDGRDDDARVLHDGVYIVVVEAGGKSAREVVTVIDGQ